MRIWHLLNNVTINNCCNQKHTHWKSEHIMLWKTMYKIWIMGLKQHNIIKWNSYKIYVYHTGLIVLGCKCKNLKMMEDEQNLKKNTDKGTHPQVNTNQGLTEVNHAN